MRKAALLYNPLSGGGRKPRLPELESVLQLIRERGIEAEIVPCESSEHAKQQAQRALEAGCDTIFACGGDGTIHDIVQVVANSSAALAVLPMGTANTLAHDLGIPFDLRQAAECVLNSTPRRVALG